MQGEVDTVTQKLYHKAINSKGGETMKTLTLVLALLLVSSVAFAATETAQMDVYGRGFSYIGPPLVPITTSFPNTPEIFEPAGVYVTDESTMEGTITRFDAPSQGMIDYYPGDTEWSLLLGEGYQVDYRQGGPAKSAGQWVPIHVVYTGVEDGVPDADGTMTDMWISLPGNQLDAGSAGGWHWISCPFNHEIHFNVNWESDDNDGLNIKVTDGNIVRSIGDASTNHLTPPASDQWIDGQFNYFLGQYQGWQTAGWDIDNNDTTVMSPGRCYMVKTFVDNLALIIPAYDPVP